MSTLRSTTIVLLLALSPVLLQAEESAEDAFFDDIEERDRSRMERRHGERRRFFDTLPEAEREAYRKRFENLREARDSFPELGAEERREMRRERRELRDHLQGRREQMHDEIRALPPGERRAPDSPSMHILCPTGATPSNAASRAASH